MKWDSEEGTWAGNLLVCDGGAHCLPCAAGGVWWWLCVFFWREGHTAVAQIRPFTAGSEGRMK